jgi:hypothetical protein
VPNDSDCSIPERGCIGLDQPQHFAASKVREYRTAAAGAAQPRSANEALLTCRTDLAHDRLFVHDKAMASVKDLKLAQKIAAQQQQLISELEALVKDIERCERTILDLQQELGAANAKYPSPRTTREDIGYLTELLRCANKKLVWEKHLAALQKRTPPLLERMSRLMEDPQNPPQEEVRAQVLRALQAVQAAMERLSSAKMN